MPSVRSPPRLPARLVPRRRHPPLPVPALGPVPSVAAVPVHSARRAAVAPQPRLAQQQPNPQERRVRLLLLRVVLCPLLPQLARRLPLPVAQLPQLSSPAVRSAAAAAVHSAAPARLVPSARSLHRTPLPPVAPLSLRQLQPLSPRPRQPTPALQRRCQLRRLHQPPLCLHLLPPPHLPQLLLQRWCHRCHASRHSRRLPKQRSQHPLLLPPRRHPPPQRRLQLLPQLRLPRLLLQWQRTRSEHRRCLASRRSASSRSHRRSSSSCCRLRPHRPRRPWRRCHRLPPSS